MSSSLVETTETTQTVVAQPAGLAGIMAEIKAKCEADLIRFRTCCADPRASK